MPSQRQSGNQSKEITALGTLEDLDKAWAKIIQFCETKWQTRLENMTSVEHVIDRIRPPAEDLEARERARTVFRKALKCIDVVGQIAAQAASAVGLTPHVGLQSNAKHRKVFAPSQQAMNGVSFVIKALQSYGVSMRLASVEFAGTWLVDITNTVQQRRFSVNSRH